MRPEKSGICEGALLRRLPTRLRWSFDSGLGFIIDHISSAGVSSTYIAPATKTWRVQITCSTCHSESRVLHDASCCSARLSAVMFFGN